MDNIMKMIEKQNYRENNEYDTAASFSDIFSPYTITIIKKLSTDRNSVCPVESMPETEKMYNLLKLIYEIDRLKKMSIYYPLIEKGRILTAILMLKKILKNQSDTLKTSSIFGQLTDVDGADKHPYVIALENSKLQGKTYEDAAAALCKGLRINPMILEQFSERMHIDYPHIDKYSREFSEGMAAARRDSTSASIANAYRWAERDVQANPGSVDNFIAGYMQAYKAANDEIDRERQKAIIARFGNNDDQDDLLTRKLKEMAARREI